MNYIIPYKFRLVPRNEGKIKSYESCLDVRAWSHDVEARGGHLRTWIKNDMPICVLPISAIALSLRTMGCRQRGRLTPRCHPNCKSKVVLESICTSCQTIKQCLQNDPKYEKYFEDEELETSHWPCERCLEALKSIKMLWRIIMEKVFRINIPKTEKFPSSTRTENVHNTAKSWQSDIIHEAIYVKNVIPLFDRGENSKANSCQFESQDCVTIASRIIPTKHVSDGSTGTVTNDKLTVLPENAKVTEDREAKDESKMYHRPRKVNRCISVKIKKFDASCETVGDGDKDVYKNNFNELQQRFIEQKADLDRLKKENVSLKIELQNVFNGFTLDPHMCSPSANILTNDALAVLPKPFDDEQTGRIVDDVDSEMIITMKNCRNPNSKQVSLLQVLHKSNQPFYCAGTETNCRREDPIHVLSKIHTTFGAIMQREIGLVGDKQRNENPPSDIDASYHNVKISGSSFKLDVQKKLSFFIHRDCTEDVEK